MQRLQFLGSRVAGLLGCAMACAVAFGAPVSAQQAYAQVKGWSITQADYGRGPVCSMFRTSGDDRFFLRFEEGGWKMGFRSVRAPGDVTTIDMDIDRASEVWSATVVSGGYAVAHVTPQWVDGIASARVMQAAVDGGPMRDVPASGTAAAITKMKECGTAFKQQTVAPTQGAFAQAEFQPYANVRGWEVFTNTPGCTAQRVGEVIVSFHTPPFGGWELHVEDLAGLPNGTEFAGRVVVDGQAFANTFFVDNGRFIGSFELPLRKAMAAGTQANIIWQDFNLPVSLSGVTAALLKVEECWQVLTGYDASTSSRAGTYAFR